MIHRISMIAVAALVSVTGAAQAEEPSSKVKLVRTPDRGIQPQAALDARGIVHLIYFKGTAGNGDIFYAHSEDAAAHFSRPLRVNSVPSSAIATGNIRGAHLALGKGGRVHVAWMGSSKSKSESDPTPMLYARLNDEGNAFEPQRNIIREAYGLDGGGSVYADEAGNVGVAWHAPTPGAKGEQNRRVWVARSTDEGKTFAREFPASDTGIGACGCCSLRAMSHAKGNIYMLYRSATDNVGRDTYLVTSSDKGKSFRADKLQAWNINICPMSSFALSESHGRVLAAWETDGQVYFAGIDATSGKRSEAMPAPGSGGGRKHPVVVANGRGETLLVWTEGMGWNRGGGLRWQLFDRDGKPTGEGGRADGVPTWSLVTAFARPDGGFTIIY
jgi:hypothetical protein